MEMLPTAVRGSTFRYYSSAIEYIPGAEQKREHRDGDGRAQIPGLVQSQWPNHRGQDVRIFRRRGIDTPHPYHSTVAVLLTKGAPPTKTIA